MFQTTFEAIKSPRLGILCCGFLLSSALHAAVTVTPSGETDPTTRHGDAIDDPAIWIHPSDPAKSLIVGTNKKSGYSLYTLEGRTVHTDDRAAFNNIDVRYGYEMPDGRKLDLIVASDKHNKAFHVFGFSEKHQQPEVLMEPVKVDSTVYGTCLYHSAKTNQYYVFTTGKDGQVFQYQLHNHNGKIAASLERKISVSSTVEGCVADDEYGELFFGEEEVGIWSMGAEPSDRDAPKSVASIADHDYLAADIEGLALYATRSGEGYLIASVQSRDEFAVFERERPHRYLYSFKVGSGLERSSGDEVDAVSHTDGIEIISTSLGSSYPFGLFLAQDDENTATNGRTKEGQNFKLVPVESIANAAPVPFALDAAWDPRAPKQARR